MQFEEGRSRRHRRMPGLLASTAMQAGLLVAFMASHVDVPRGGREVFLQLVLAPPPAPTQPRPLPAPRQARAPARARDAPGARDLSAPVSPATPSIAVPSRPPAEAPGSAPVAPLDLSAATVHRAIAAAERASASLAAQVPSTRPTFADQRAQALAQARRPACLAPEDPDKPSKSRIHLGGLLALPGTLYDAATGQCSTK